MTDQRGGLITAGAQLTAITQTQVAPLAWVEAIEVVNHRQYGANRSPQETAQDWISYAKKGRLTARMELPKGLHVWIEGNQVFP